MMNDLLSFENKKECNDFLIALVVIAFFGWLFFQFGFFSFNKNEPPEESLAATAINDIAAERDQDKDGILDIYDKCPKLAGLKKFGGCPADTDGDGVYDAEDKCPELAGTAINNGCPKDSDGDGFYDSIDKCPNIKGKDKGCPPLLDSDKDGILNKDDKCPLLAGIPENNGCPSDKDQDGVYDTKDDCPELAGPKENNGCPNDTNPDRNIIKEKFEEKRTNSNKEKTISSLKEKNNNNTDTDGDGVYDIQDKCPNVFGIAANKGCPADIDGDGIYDKDDKCPKLKGVAANNGCPADRDGDGVYDKDDKCPDKAGKVTEDGCPELVLNEKDKATISRAIGGVKFLISKATLTEYSKGIIKEVYEILKKNPDYKLDIIGHTDSVGEEADNLKLSKKRAKTCLDLLVKMGIDRSRLSSTGYGESRPINSNKTKAEQLANRRVEFVVKY